MRKRKDQVKELREQVKRFKSMYEISNQKHSEEFSRALEYRGKARDILQAMGEHGSSLNMRWVAGKLAEMLK